MFGASNSPYSPHGDSLNSIYPNQSTFMNLLIQLKNQVDEFAADNKRRTRELKLRCKKYQAQIQPSEISQIGNSESRNPDQVIDQATFQATNSDHQISEANPEIHPKINPVPNLPSTKMKQQSQSPEPATIFIHPMHCKFQLLNNISTNPETEIHRSRNSDQASEEVRSDNQCNRGGGLTATMMMPTAEAPTKPEQDLHNYKELRGDSGAEVGTSARGTIEEAADQDSGSSAFAERTKKMTSCDRDLRLEQTRTGLVHRVSPIVTKPPPLMVAVFPWDREVGPRMGKKQEAETGGVEWNGDVLDCMVVIGRNEALAPTADDKPQAMTARVAIVLCQRSAREKWDQIKTWATTLFPK